MYNYLAYPQEHTRKFKMRKMLVAFCAAYGCIFKLRKNGEHPVMRTTVNFILRKNYEHPVMRTTPNLCWKKLASILCCFMGIMWE